MEIIPLLQGGTLLSMLEWLFSWEVSSWIVGLAVAAALGVLALDDFRLAKLFFLIAAADAFGGVGMGITKAEWATWQTALVAFVATGAIGASTVLAFRYVDSKKRAKETKNSGPTISGTLTIAQNEGKNGQTDAPKPEAPVSTPTPSHKAIAPQVVFSQTTQGINGMVMFNSTDVPIDNVSFSVMRSHAGPETEADPSLLQRDLDSTVSVNIGTLLPSLATPIRGIPASILPYPDRPSYYQVNIFTRYEAFTEYLYVTPKEGTAMFDQAVDLSSNKTHKWIYRETEKAMKSWKNWPEWWK